MERAPIMEREHWLWKKSIDYEKGAFIIESKQ